MAHADCIFEIGTEELPPTALKNLSESLGDSVKKQLQSAKLSYQSFHLFATPRRLAFFIQSLDDAQSDQEIERRGPSYQAAFDDNGEPTKAATGFARSCGVTVSDLSTMETKKGKWLYINTHKSGEKTTTLLPKIVKEALMQLPIPKRMRWGDSTVEFVRPVHWLLFLFDSNIVSCELFGQKASNVTFGHRFHAPDEIVISEPQMYEKALLNACVIANFSVRQNQVKEAIEQAAAQMNAVAKIDSALLEEVTSLLEYPNPIVGEFDQKYLDLPKEVLVSSMKKHQKYFHFETSSGNLLPKFMTLSNINSIQPNIIKHGNERVIRARLEDAEFFWKQDISKTLASRFELLKSVLFQKELGSVYDRVQRIGKLAKVVAKSIGANHEWVARAVLLSKTDLMTEMVGEFPELQGIMGRCYAMESGEPEEVAVSLDEQYLPRFSGDRLATTKTGQCLALADRFDLIVGIFSIGQKPTGDKDPFGLRRAALGIVRTLVEKSIKLDIQIMIDLAIEQINLKVNNTTKNEVHAYLIERLRGYYLDQKISPDVLSSVLSCQRNDLSDIDDRLSAVVKFKALEASISLSAANKRVGNILKKATEPIPDAVNRALLTEGAEQALYQALMTVSEIIKPWLEKRQYTNALDEMATLRPTVDQFFDDVMVMVDDQLIRQNRLALLQTMNKIFLKIADLGKLKK